RSPAANRLVTCGSRSGNASRVTATAAAIASGPLKDSAVEGLCRTAPSLRRARNRPRSWARDAGNTSLITRRGRSVAVTPALPRRTLPLRGTGGKQHGRPGERGRRPGPALEQLGGGGLRRG